MMDKAVKKPVKKAEDVVLDQILDQVSVLRKYAELEKQGIIKHEGGKYVLYSHKGKVLGRHGSRSKAVAQEHAIQAAKHAGADEPGKRDGTGPAKGSFRRNEEGKSEGRRQEAGGPEKDRGDKAQKPDYEKRRKGVVKGVGAGIGALYGGALGAATTPRGGSGGLRALMGAGIGAGAGYGAGALWNIIRRYLGYSAMGAPVTGELGVKPAEALPPYPGDVAELHYALAFAEKCAAYDPDMDALTMLIEKDAGIGGRIAGWLGRSVGRGYQAFQRGSGALSRQLARGQGSLSQLPGKLQRLDTGIDRTVGRLGGRLRDLFGTGLTSARGLARGLDRGADRLAGRGVRGVRELLDQFMKGLRSTGTGTGPASQLTMGAGI
jgi:hypothetical protein